MRLIGSFKEQDCVPHCCLVACEKVLNEKQSSKNVLVKWIWSPELMNSCGVKLSFMSFRPSDSPFQVQNLCSVDCSDINKSL